VSAEVLKTIRGYAAANRITLTGHARKRMAERNVRYADIRTALVNARSCRPADGTNWRATGPDVDGDDLDVVVALEDGLIVVTIY
jgi:hypothetical protein